MIWRLSQSLTLNAMCQPTSLETCGQAILNYLEHCVIVFRLNERSNITFLDIFMKLPKFEEVQ